jgi:hypothetical protein
MTNLILQGASNEDQTTVTLPSHELNLLHSAISEKVTELEVARISLKEFTFPNKIMQSAFTCITKQNAYKAH